MFRFLISTSALTLTASALLAADIPADSTIEAATLYPRGATLTRSATFDATAGQHRIIIDDLPLSFDPASLRIEGAGDAAFTILSVDHRVDRLPPEEDVKSPERLALEDEIEELEGDIRDLETQIATHRAAAEVAAKRIAFIDGLIEREAERMAEDVDAARAGTEIWTEALGVISTEMERALADQIAAEVRVGNVEREIEEVEETLEERRQALAALDLPPPPRSIATVTVATETDVQGILALSYRVNSAGWEPVYDLRLERGEENSLQLDRHARVYQQTGEDWSGIDMTLSTARPSGRMAAPDLPPYIIQIFSGFQERRKVGASLAPQAMLADRAERDLMVAEEAPAPEPVFVQQAEMQTEGETIVYRISNPVDVSGDGTVRQVGIDTSTFAVDLLARSTPVLDTNAYLYGAWENALGGPLLPGRAAIFREGGFVGQIRLPFIAAGDEAELPFGLLDSLVIARNTLEREDGDFGLIGTTNRRVERYEITARNVGLQSIPLVITDNMPVSENENVEVTPYARPKPTETDIDGKRGVQSWRIDLAPGADTRIEFGHTVTWPGDMQIILP